MEAEEESKIYGEINCISNVIIKEEIIIPDNVPEDESTLSDVERIDIKYDECLICCKYRSMFIMLKNHDCPKDNKCESCEEINHWTNCYKSHKESHVMKEPDISSDSTVSDIDEASSQCKICSKYEFMVPLLKSHVCHFDSDDECGQCNEVLDWVNCFDVHRQSHQPKSNVQDNFSDSTVSDSEEIYRLLSPFKSKFDKCMVCLKYQAMYMILEENHLCDPKKLNKKCSKCKELSQWNDVFYNHQKSHEIVSKEVTNYLHSSGKFECGICLNLNSIVTHLVKNHKCYNKKCKICKEALYWLSCLKSHKETETLLEFNMDKSLTSIPHQKKCSICVKFHSTLSSLSSHRCCKKNRKQKCRNCLEISFWHQNFILHTKHHKTEALKNVWSCTNCGKQFSREKVLNMHKPYCKTLKFSCKICNRRFLNIFSLKKHRYFQACHNVKYRCEICKKSFSNLSEVKNHKILHDLKLIHFSTI